MVSRHLCSHIIPKLMLLHNPHIIEQYNIVQYDA